MAEQYRRNLYIDPSVEYDPYDPIRWTRSILALNQAIDLMRLTIPLISLDMNITVKWVYHRWER